MSQKEKIINILHQGEPMSQREIVRRIYDRPKPNAIIQKALSDLLKTKVIVKVKIGTRAALFSLNQSSEIEETISSINREDHPLT